MSEMAIFRDEMRMASLLAEGDVLVLVINQRNFRKILRDRPECSLVVTRTLAERLKEATQQLESVESTAQAKPVLEDSLS